MSFQPSAVLCTLNIVKKQQLHASNMLTKNIDFGVIMIKSHQVKNCSWLLIRFFSCVPNASTLQSIPASLVWQYGLL